MWAMCVSWVLNLCIYWFFIVGIQFTVEYSLIRRPHGLGVRIWNFTWWVFIALFVDIQMITDSFGQQTVLAMHVPWLREVYCDVWMQKFSTAHELSTNDYLQCSSHWVFTPVRKCVYILCGHCNETVLCIWHFSQVSWNKDMPTYAV